MMGRVTAMKKAFCVFYTFDEFDALLGRVFFTNGEHYRVEVKDTYFWRVVLDDPNLSDDSEELLMSDYDALPALSKILGMRLENTHVSHDGIWLEGLPQIPKRTSRK